MNVDTAIMGSAGGVPAGSQGRQEIVCSGNTFVVCVRLAGGRVEEAWSTGKLLRNMNVLLQGGLDEQGESQFVQQAHCLCNDGHALAAVRALEDLADVVLPRNAELVRSLVQTLRCIQEHLLHVYQFHLSDWAHLEPALRADPARAARLVQHPEQEADYFRSARERLQTLAGGQGPNPFGGGFSGHPDYRGEDELHLALHAHALEALQIRTLLTKALGLLGCGPDGFKAYHLGGLPADMDLGAGVRGQLRGVLAKCQDFVCQTFLADLERLSLAYAHWADRGAVRAFLSWGDFARPSGEGLFFPGGMVTRDPGTHNGDGGWEMRTLRPEAVSEDKEPAWNPQDADHYRLRFDPSGPVFRWGEGAFGWLSAPRHGKDACEVGSLARVLGAWMQGRKTVRRFMDATLATCGLAPAAMNSTLGRLLSRGIEAAILAQGAVKWLDELESSLSSGETIERQCLRLPDSGVGTGRVEVPRGTLTHTIRLENRRIVNHDYLIPSLWNFSPRDAHGLRGPLEQALLGTPVADPARPLEVLRTIHALDPCNTCQLVVED